MKVKYRQQNNYGCISFALANIFDEHRFLEDLPNDGPVRMADVRGKMVEFLPDLFIQEIFITSHKLDCGNRLQVCQREILKPISDGDLENAISEGVVIPFILTVINASGNQHAVAFIWDPESSLYYLIDSNSEDIIVNQAWWFVENYFIVGVAQFGLWDGGDCGLMLQKRDLAHIFGCDK